MKVYKLNSFLYYTGLEISFLSVTENTYFESLDLALAYLVKYCHLDLPWSIDLYSGFLPVRTIARGVYA